MVCTTMIDCTDCTIESLALYKITAQSELSPVSAGEMELNDDLKDLMLRYFFSSFKNEPLYTFSGDAFDEEESVATRVKSIFKNPDSFSDEAQKIAAILQEASVHPQVKDGNLYIVFFRNCRFRNEECDAVGLFKAEVMETYIDLVETPEGIRIERKEGFSISKIDKGCVVCNHDAGNGYVMGIVDTVNKNRNASYWVDFFLRASLRKDSRFYTKNTLKSVTDFITKELPKEKSISKMEQIEVLNQTMDYLNKHDKFNTGDYSGSVLKDDETRHKFREFLSKRGDDIGNWDNFPISEETVRQSNRFMKRVIKLGKDFSIYVHGNTELMKKGFDSEKGLQYYQFFFSSEK